MKTPLMIIMLLGVTLSGCFGDEAGVGTAPINEPARAPASLDAQPDWRVGDWWTLRLVHPLTGHEQIVTQVVAEIYDGTAIVGTTDIPSREMLILEAPLWGEVRLADLSTSLREEGFQSVSFPLEEDVTWETAFDGRPVAATVVRVDGSEATIRYDEIVPDPTPVDTLFPALRRHLAWAVYDADARTLTSLDDDFTRGGYDAGIPPGLGEWQVMDHGAGHAGPVYVPNNRTVAFHAYWDGFHEGPRADIVAQFTGQQVEGAAQRMSIDVSEGYTDLSLVLAIGAPFPSPPTVQAGEQHVHTYHYAPDDGPVIDSWHLAHAVLDPGSDIKVLFVGSDDPTGEWTTYVEYAVGAGEVLAKGIVYTLVKYDEPGGEPVVLG